jgi:2-methylisoborneol synthase
MTDVMCEPGSSPTGTALAEPAQPIAAPPGEHSPAPSPRPARRGLPGPTGIGTASTQLSGRVDRGGQAEIYCPPPARDDPALAERIEADLTQWAEEEAGCVSPDERAEFNALNFGRAVVLSYPDHAEYDHLLGAARLFAAEYIVDEMFCEEEGARSLQIGPSLAAAQAAIDPTHLPAEYDLPWREGLDGHPALRGMKSAMDYFTSYATTEQAHRYRHDIAMLYLGYEAEAGWYGVGRTPEVWEYLMVRQVNSFRPCVTVVDSVAGYELPNALYTHPRVQRATAIGGLATTLMNDLVSFNKEQRLNPSHHNLPTVIAANEGLSIEDAYAKAVDIHNDRMHAYENEMRDLSEWGNAVLDRYLTGIWNWIGGNYAWHARHNANYE